MGWFDEQIKTRMQNDKEKFENSFIDLSSVIIGRSAITAALNDDKKKTQNAIEEILKFYHVKPTECPEQMEDMNERLEFLLRPSGIMRRKVNLTGKWYKDAIGPLLGQTKQGDTVALIPKGIAGYEFFDYEQNKKVAVNNQTRSLLCEEAFCFYKPLPMRKLGIIDLLRYIAGTITAADLVMIGLVTLAATGLGLFAPLLNKLVFAKIVPSGNAGLLLPVACLFLGVTISTSIIDITKSLIMSRVQTKMSMAVQSASMSRLMSLPANFFKGYSAGDLSSRATGMEMLTSMLADAILSTGLTSLFSLIYIGQIFQFAPSLVFPALAIILTMLVFSLVSTLLQLKRSRRLMKLGTALSGIVFALFSGIQKIKLSGAERRAFSKWTDTYKKVAQDQYNPSIILKIAPIFTAVVSMLGVLVLYYFAAVSQVSVADYMAFNVAYGMVSAAILSLSGVFSTCSNIKPIMELVEPILKAVPEVSTDKKILTKLSGAIELNNVSFRYSENMPLIIDNLSLKIKAGQYVAVVGATGCGKSTLMRLMLGFETPQKGAVYFDGKDLEKIDLKSLRQHIGVVMQNGKLFSGDIFSNIIISAPWLSLDDAWKAAELAGMADDIRDMPMGMNTIISEGNGGISGGQKQRLMIAREIAPGPKILMFDEATSALDNITQKQVSASLDNLKSTRIVIAHRLSTIKQSERIIVLDKGKIIEDGKYDELIANNGYFAELVNRQRLDS